MSEAAYGVSFDGCPYVFATAGCPASVTSADESWSAAWTVQPAMLDWPRGRVTERMGTHDAQLDANGRTFTIRDLALAGGPHAGRTLGATFLFTRRATQFAQAAIASDIEEGSTTFTLASTVGFPSGAQVIWVEGEAIYGSRSGTTFNITTRGYYGSRVVPHLRDASRGYAPIAWGGWRGVTKQRALLWKVVGGVASVVWRGYAQQAPALADDGESYDVPCQHTWARLKDTRIGVQPVTTRLSGWWLPGSDDPYAQDVALSADLRKDGERIARSLPRVGEAARICKTLDELCGVLQQRLQADVNAKGLSGVLVTVTRDGAKLTLTAIGPEATFDQAFLVGSGSLPVPSSSVVGGTRTAKCEATEENYTPAYLPLTDGNGNSVSVQAGLDTSLGLPSSFARTTITVLPGTVTYQPVLRSAPTDDPYLAGYSLVLRPSSVDAANATLTASVEFVPEAREPRPLGNDKTLREARDAKLTLAITADHWVYAIDYAIVSPLSFIRTPADERDWSRELEQRVVDATDGSAGASRVRWYFDGERTFGEGITSHARLYGCAVGVRAGGKVGIVPLRPPLPTDEPVATFTADDYLDGTTPRYEPLPEEVRTSAQIETGGLTVVVNDLDSEATYGQTAPIEVKPLGALEGQAREVPSPDYLATQLLRDVLGPWSRPSALHTLTVSRDRWGDELFHGDLVEFDAFNAPDGAGGRGLVGARGLVLSKEYGEDDESLALGVVVFEAAERIAALAPCWRVASISGAVITVAIDYLAGNVSDYAGSNLSSYRYAANGEDGGTSWARVGMRLRLVTRDATTQLALGGLVVSGFNPGARTITVQSPVSTSPNDWPALVAAGIVDLVFDEYATAITDAQKDFAYVGSESTNTIDGTADAPNRWAP